MEQKWKLVESMGLTAQEIMTKDFELLNQLDSDSPMILHLYEWATPSLTYGYFINPNTHLNLEVLQKEGIAFAKRPTGGGIIFHLCDFAFSLLIPAHYPCIKINPLDNYYYINRQISNIVRQLTQKEDSIELLKQSNPFTHSKVDAFCMAKPTQYDIILEGKKIGGAAQRKTKKGILHQGSLSLKPLPETLLKKVLTEPQEVFPCMQEESGFLIENSDISIEEMRKALKFLLKRQMNHFFTF